MKSILLTSTALVAFAGAAAADGHAGIAFSGSADLGYNTDVAGDNDGFYSSIELDVTMSATLDNGVTVSATADIDELDSGTATAGAVTLVVASEMATLTYGDVEFAAVDKWSSVGSMDQDGFEEVDGERVLRADVNFAGVAAAVSYEVDANNQDLTNLSAGATATFGSVSAAVAFQSDEGDHADIMGVRIGTSFAGADVALGFASSGDENSTGVSLSYPVGPVTLAASYVSESAGDDNWDVSAAYAAGAVTATVYTDESEDWGIEGTYDMGNGLALAAGMVDGGEDLYVAGTYDLGGGASLLVSYADDGDADGAADDEIGAGDYQIGTTVEVSFSF